MSVKPARRIGVLGGTFDPIHLGHLIIAEEIAFRLRLDQMLFLPTKYPPHKRDLTVSPDPDRVAMTAAAIAGNQRFRLSLIDIERGGLSYTADSLGLIQQEYPDATIVFVMGEDSLRDLPRWHDPNRVARQAPIVVARRPGIDVDLESIFKNVPDARGRVEIVDVPLIGISATDIRHRVRSGQPIRYLVPDVVAAYIQEHGLYRP